MFNKWQLNELFSGIFVKFRAKTTEKPQLKILIGLE